MAVEEKLTDADIATVQTRAGDFTIGFIGLRDDGPTAVPIGSGTFARLGSISGVLTCAHVIDQLKRERLVGVVHFASERRLTGLRFDPGAMEFVKRGPSETAEGPDIGFIRLPEEVTSELGAIASTLNLDKQIELAQPPARVGQRYLDVVLGVVGEWSAQSGLRFKANAIMCFGVLTPLCEGDLDLWRFRPAQGTLPRSYGGVSGGGQWRFYYTGNTGQLEFIERRFRGVAFFETDPPEPEIIGHGPKAVLRTLVQDIRAKWPEVPS